MAELQRIGGLQVEQDLGFQRAEWRVESWARVIIAVFLLLTLLGLFGSGPLCRARAASASGSLVVQYDRFARRDSPSSLLIDAKGGPNSEVGIRFSDAELQALQINDVVPQQVRTESSRAGHTYIFRSGSDGSIRVRFDVQPQSAGRMNGEVGIAGGDSVTFWSLIYP